MRTRINLSILVFLLSVAPHACVVEQAIAAFSEILPHSHDSDSGAHQKPTPSHCHDEKESEGEFCCDNQFFSYIGVHNLKLDIEFSLAAISLVNLPALQAPVSPTQLLSPPQHYRQPLYLRGRDQYALTCLLHAPPSFQ